MISLRSSCSVILTYILLSPSIHCQDQAIDSTSLKQGAWALQFGIGSNFSLTSFQGFSIAAKYHLSSTNALRAGVTITGATNNGTSLSRANQADSLANSESSSLSSNSTTVNFVVQYLWYLGPSRPIHFYLALGPAVSYTHSSDGQDAINYYNLGIPTAIRTLSSSRYTQWGLGANVAVGVEWFAVHWFSLRAEYANTVQYQWATKKTTSTNENSQTTIVVSTQNSSSSSNGWSFGSQGVSFGLNVYF